tara:strand:+ start:1190 stop:1984 length:795 start_codon:yes stop_codon:yes gene_type:complete
MKLLTPISHLFNNKKDAQNISKVSDFLEARERTCNLKFKNTTHYHIDFDLNIGLSDKELQFLKDHVYPREEIQILTFQASRDSEKVKIKNGMFFPDSNILDISEQIKNTKESISKIRNIVGKDRFIGIENNNYYPTGAYDICTSTEYLNAVINTNNCHLLFDIAHALVTCTNRKISFSDYSETLLKSQKCLQMHLCQPSYFFNNGIFNAIDAHEVPSFEITELAILMGLNWNIEFLTVEYYKDAEKLISYLKFIKEQIKNYERK